MIPTPPKPNSPPLLQRQKKKNYRATKWLRLPVSAAISLITLWLFGAIYFDGPAARPGGWNTPLAVIWLSSSIIISSWGRFGRFWQWRLLLCGLPVYVYWLSVRPSNERDWQAEFAQTGHVDIQGDRLTFHQVRNFDYQADGSPTGQVTERWETRTHHLSQLNGIDLHFDAFGGKIMAHPMLSFDFGDEGRLVLSIETRREKHESFSAIGGLYKMFELQYIFGDEADLVKVRSNIRNEPMYLYRTSCKPEQARELLLDCIKTQNQLSRQPRWYNAITANCTTSYRAQTPTKKRNRFDWRLLVNGQLDRMLYEKKAIVTEGLSFEELRQQALINETAKARPDAQDFSRSIRQNRAGFEQTK